MALGRPKQAICKYGHNTALTGRRRNGTCTLCARNRDQIRNKTVDRRKNHTESQWARQGIRNADGSRFSYINFDRLYQIQHGRCALCSKHQADIKNRLSVDHDHKTGVVRGLLCDNCNKNLGIVENQQFTIAAMKYLRKDTI